MHNKLRQILFFKIINMWYNSYDTQIKVRQHAEDDRSLHGHWRESAGQKVYKKRGKNLKIHKVKMCSDLQTWVTGNETPYCTLKQQKYRIYVSTFKPMWRRVVEASGCKRDFFTDVRSHFDIHCSQRNHSNHICCHHLCLETKEKKQI